MPGSIRSGYSKSDRTKELIAKKVCKTPNELTMLEHLTVLDPKSDHVIMLLDSIQTQTGWWIILPGMSSLANCLAFPTNGIERKVGGICWGLISGLAYLHGLCIAHRDIKPDNLVVDRDFCLKIIDFDLAVQLKDETEEVSDECGTETWMAPEVEDERLQKYKPIKADIWSCGRVILHVLDSLRKEETYLRVIATRLKADDPEQRPALRELDRQEDPAIFTDVYERSRGQSDRALDTDEPPKAKKARVES